MGKSLVRTKIETEMKAAHKAAIDAVEHFRTVLNMGYNTDHCCDDRLYYAFRFGESDLFATMTLLDSALRQAHDAISLLTRDYPEDLRVWADALTTKTVSQED